MTGVHYWIGSAMILGEFVRLFVKFLKKWFGGDGDSIGGDDGSGKNDS